MSEEIKTIKIRPSEIKIGRRIRSELGDLDSLISTFDEVGMLHPIGITPDKTLIFGERRLKAWQKKYGDRQIEARVFSLDENKRKFAEFVENVERKDLSWQDRARSISGVDRYGRKIFGEVKERERTDLTASAAEAVKWSELKTAETLNISPPTVSDAKLLTKTMEKHPEVAKKRTQRAALKLARKIKAKEKGETRLA